MTPDDIEQARKLLGQAIDDTDAEIIYAIRVNSRGSREALLSQLDVLEKVRERLNVRFDRIVRPE